MPHILSCSGSTVEGVSIIRQEALAALGKASTSRRDCAPVSCMMRRSTPKAKPPCGGTPYLKASSMKPKRSQATSCGRPMSLNMRSCISLEWMRMEPEPISMPLSTRS